MDANKKNKIAPLMSNKVFLKGFNEVLHTPLNFFNEIVTHEQTNN